ncbi:hypothetical protein IW261DRAFT_1026941 [Armillaria novae-zelandiae]|uniref:F-box domain-containing protein n=1 Tax=Armillaria novae-zelandiae TaxID=153914 RepID=A0AA39PDP5_9AGAR|nr:hypothetical protein IW261DRAFT_1026941 [Armillaria novae-zelandiae]
MDNNDKSDESIKGGRGRPRASVSLPSPFMSCRNCGFVLEPQPQNTNISDSLISQILRGQRPLLDSDHALLNAEIVELEQLQSLYAAQLEEIRFRQCAGLKALERRKSIYAPIRRLPRDILIEIFDSVCDSWWQEADEIWSFPQRLHSLNLSGPLWILSRVCGIWRDILHSSPASWARKLVVQAPFSKHAPEILQTYLKLTGEHFLHLRFDCPEPIKGDTILSLLVQSYQRWKKLRIFTIKQYMRHFESISQFPALQAIDIFIYGYSSDYHLDVCSRAPQLWQTSLRARKLHQIKLPPSVTHFSGTIADPEDFRLLSTLPKLRRCHLWISKAKDQAPVTVAQLTHLYVDGVHILNFLSAPLLRSLTISMSSRPLSSFAQEYIIHFLHRSRCHLESLSIDNVAFPSATPCRLFALEACSTVCRLKLSLHRYMINDIVKVLASPSVLPNLRHLILCLSPHSVDEWTAILRMVRSRRDAGSLKLFEVQFKGDEHDCYPVEDIRAHKGDNFEMRVEKWDPPRQDHLYLVRFGR